MSTGPLRGWQMWLSLAGLALALAVVNVGIAGRERVLAEGRVLLLELAPADPRSLMQGDYMALRFAAAEPIRTAMLADCPQRIGDAGMGDTRSSFECMAEEKSSNYADGYAVFSVDRDGVGRFLRMQPTPATAVPGDIAVRVRLRGWEGPRIASNAWFFPEGQADRYQPARYGELRVGDDGTALLTGLHDENRKAL